MIYYAVAMTATLILCYYKTTAYPLVNGAEAKCFDTVKSAFLVLLPLTFLALFRWNVGVDSRYGDTYWQAYQQAAVANNSRDFEVGFYWFMRLFAILKVPFFWFLFCHALLFMAGMSYAITKGSVWTKWSILVFFLLYVYFDCYSSLRQSLAEAVCLIAWANMGYAPPSSRKAVRILLLFFLAGFVHSIAWMNIPIYLICRVRFSRNGLLKFIILAVLLSPLLQVILKFAMELFGNERYDFRGVAVINAIMSGVLALLCWYFYNEITTLDENAHTYVNLAICIFVLILNSGAMFLPFRVFDMLKIGYVFIVPYLLRGIPSRRTRLYTEIGLLLILGMWFVNQFFLQEISFAANYQTVFDEWSWYTRLP